MPKPPPDTSADRHRGWASKWVWPALTFVIGGFASPVLVDIYEASKARIEGEPVTVTDRSILSVVNREGDLNPQFRVAARETGGGCEPYSLALYHNPNAHRCGWGNVVADPCFAMDEGRKVACVVDPWDPAVYVVSLTKKVKWEPSAEVPIKGLPWGVEVQDPEDPRSAYHCSPALGATAPLAGQSPTYFCDVEDSSKKAALFGRIRFRPNQLSTVDFSTGDSNTIRRASVVRLWY